MVVALKDVAIRGEIRTIVDYVLDMVQVRCLWLQAIGSRRKGRWYLQAVDQEGTMGQY
jgi:hypothetical protein